MPGQELEQIVGATARESQLMRGLSPAATDPSFAPAFIVIGEHYGR